MVLGENERLHAPPGDLKPRLNRIFIEQLAESIIQQLNEASQFRFMKILKSMGASDEDLESLGLESAMEFADLLKRIDDPEYAWLRRFEKLPPAGHTPLNCPVLRDWLLMGRKGESLLLQSVMCIGDGPFARDEFAEFLRKRAILVQDSGGVTGFVVLGREGWDEDEVDDLIERHVGRSLRIYSQEMLVAYLARDEDPFFAGSDALAAFRAGHPGLEFVSEGWPGWVETWVRADRQSAVAAHNRDYQVDLSPLRAMGYHVGKSGEEADVRHSILTLAFQGQLPIVSNHAYMQQWGNPGTPQRLRKIATHIAHSCSDARNRSGWEVAVEDWESDLEWLKESYYRGHMQFHWPDTFV